MTPNAPQVIVTTGGRKRAPRDAVVIDVRSWTISRDGSFVMISRAACRFAALILAARGATVEHWEIIEAMYGDDRNGGPLGAENILKTHKCRANLALRHIGLVLRTQWGVGCYAGFLPMPATETQAAA